MVREKMGLIYMLNGTVSGLPGEGDIGRIRKILRRSLVPEEELASDKRKDNITALKDIAVSLVENEENLAKYFAMTKQVFYNIDDVPSIKEVIDGIMKGAPKTIDGLKRLEV